MRIVQDYMLGFTNEGDASSTSEELKTLAKL